MINKSKNVFISHYGKDDEYVQKLKARLVAKGYNIKNSSIDSTKSNNATNPDYIRRLLRLRIHWAGTFICLIGPRTHTRQWVNWEIKKAQEKGKKIVGVFTPDAPMDCRIPSNLQSKFGHNLTRWRNLDSITKALEGEDIGWCGTMRRPNPVKVHRVKCQ